METVAPPGRRRYRNPPIDEAVCEFHFGPGPDWDLTIPGKLHSVLASEYDGKPSSQQSIDVGVEIKKDEPSNLRYGQRLSKVLLFTQDQTRAVGVGPDVLSVHMLRPYQRSEPPEEGGWDEFRPRIATALKAYWEVAKPAGVRRISVRYINRIVIPEPTVRIEHYLRSAVPLVPGLPEAVNNFMSRTDYRCEDGAHLVLAHGTFTPPSGDIGFLLDIDVYWESAGLLSREEALAKTDRLRDLERDAFEAVITDAARELFDADQD